jgi:hypothetical protein
MLAHWVTEVAELRGKILLRRRLSDENEAKQCFQKQSSACGNADAL